MANIDGPCKIVCGSTKHVAFDKKGAPVAQRVKRWPADLAVPGSQHGILYKWDSEESPLTSFQLCIRKHVLFSF